jgi:hypothetical protein
LAILLYGIVLISSSREPFCIFVTSLGGIFIFIGVLGALGVVRGRYKPVLYLYDVLLGMYTQANRRCRWCGDA